MPSIFRPNIISWAVPKFHLLLEICLEIFCFLQRIQVWVYQLIIRVLSLALYCFHGKFTKFYSKHYFALKALEVLVGTTLQIFNFKSCKKNPPTLSTLDYNFKPFPNKKTTKFQPKLSWYVYKIFSNSPVDFQDVPPSTAVWQLTAAHAVQHFFILR